MTNVAGLKGIAILRSGRVRRSSIYNNVSAGSASAGRRFRDLHTTRELKYPISVTKKSSTARWVNRMAVGRCVT
jgi:hypothetical protein